MKKVVQVHPFDSEASPLKLDPARLTLWRNIRLAGEDGSPGWSIETHGIHWCVFN